MSDLGQRFIAYYRVSTDRQGKSGLGLEAQEEAVARYVAARGGRLVNGVFREVESGRKDDRPELTKALEACRRHKATLIIAKIDRLARDARFLLNIVHGAGEGGVVFCDLPDIPPGPVGKFMLTQMAAVAELEAGLISQRTKAALAAAKDRRKAEGKPPLGGKRANSPDIRQYQAQGSEAGTKAQREQARHRAEDLAPVLAEIREAGITSLGGMARALNERGIRTTRGGEWSAVQVSRIVARVA